MSVSIREAILRLSAAQGLGPRRLVKLLEAFPDPRELIGMPRALLAERFEAPAELIARILEAARDGEFAARELLLAERCGIRVLTWADEDYPEALRQIADPPAVLYCRGSAAWLDYPCVAVVGCRRPSLYGAQTAQRLARDLAAQGVCVVSGLALGIDAAAHRGALEGGGPTVAVLGSGLCRIGPAENLELAEAAARQGALLSEFPLEYPALPENFPKRNRIVSGLSLGVVVVEAALRSGSLITARLALEQNREVFAIPGRVESATAQGPHRLIREGAALATSAADIVEDLGLSPCAESVPEARAEGVEAQGGLLGRLSAQAPKGVEELSAESGLPLAELHTVLLRLELSGRIRQLPGKRYVRQGA